jgi:hypothetical protein
VIRGFGDPNRGEVIRRHRMGVLRDDIDAALERDWQLTEALLDRLRDEVARAYAGFLLVSIPIRMQVEDAEWAEFEKAAGRPLDREAIQRHLAGWASARDVPFVDLLPALRDASRQQPVYFRIDAHWNARGHALAAREILAALASQGLLPEGKR